MMCIGCLIQVEDELLYVVNSLGGRSTYALPRNAPGSLFRYNAAQRLDASPDTLSLRFFARSGQLIDAFTLRKGLSVEPTVEAVHPISKSTKARVAFSVPSRDAVELLLLDATGHEVGQVFKGSLPAGHHEVLWSWARLLSGTYLFAAAERALGVGAAHRGAVGHGSARCELRWAGRFAQEVAALLRRSCSAAGRYTLLSASPRRRASSAANAWACCRSSGTAVDSK